MIDGFRLDPEEQKTLREQDRKIAVLKDTITKMGRIGLPVEDLQAQLDTNIRIRDGFLREFGSPIVPR